MDVPSPLSQQPPQDDLSSRLSNVEELLAQKEEQSSKRIQEQKMQLNSLQALKGKDENRPASEQHDVLAKVAQLEEAVKQCSEGVNHATLKAEAESNKKSIEELRATMLAAMEQKDEALRAAMEKKDEENARKTEELRTAMEQKDEENACKTEELRAAMLAAMEQKDEQLQELRATTEMLQSSVDEIADSIRKCEMASCLSNWLLLKLHANEMQWGGQYPLIIDLANFLNVFFNCGNSCYMQASPEAQYRMCQAYIERQHGYAAAHLDYYRIMPAGHLESVYQEKAATDPFCYTYFSVPLLAVYAFLSLSFILSLSILRWQGFRSLDQNGHEATSRPSLVTVLDGRARFNQSVNRSHVQIHGSHDQKAAAQSANHALWPETVITNEIIGLPISMESADLNGDGYPDLLFASHRERIVWIPTLSNGTFDLPRTITGNIGSGESAIAADLDGDGDLDVVSTSHSDDKLAWYANDGHGVFGDQIVLSTDLPMAGAARVADLDGDGDLDIICTSRTDNAVSWFANDGHARFGPRTLISTSAVTAPFLLVVADLDSDGALDVLAVGAAATNLTWLRNGGGATSWESRFIAGAWDNTFPSLAVADLNRDGHLDLLVGTNSDHTLTLYFNGQNNQSGHFSSSTLSLGTQPSGLSTGDLDGDGWLDIVVGRLDSVLVLYQSNDAAFTLTRSSSHALPRVGGELIVTADLDADGKLDIVTAGERNDAAFWLRNLDGDGTMAKYFLINRQLDGPEALQIIDWDRDGNMDIFGLGRANFFIGYFPNNGSASFREQVPLALNVYRPQSAAIVDWDHDGLYNALIGGQDELFQLFPTINSSQEGYRLSLVTSMTDSYYTAFVVADLDMNNVTDVLFASNFMLAWYPLSEMGPSIDVKIIADNVRVVAAAVVDLNGDGINDVVTAEYTGSRVTWYPGLGLGTFGTARTIATLNPRPSDLKVADLDEDGWADVVVLSRDANLVWYRNLGDGTFSDAIMLAVAVDGLWVVTLADLDGDSHLDVIYGCTQNISWLWGNGNGQFAAAERLTLLSSSPACMSVGDLDGDGDLDLVYGGILSNVVAVLENTLVEQGFTPPSLGTTMSTSSTQTTPSSTAVSSPEHSASMSFSGAITGVIVGIVVAVLATLMLLLVLWRRRERQALMVSPGDPRARAFWMQFEESLSQLQATNTRPDAPAEEALSASHLSLIPLYELCN
ncbi:uncharacterized protein MONBRDRAFT_28592 [Monosiga brevicollis MX1]|uniref:Uncharacterized protein n=1 Tax=Monosiga brevicollis TaxID=81824 RepID=A9V8M2_MONBE|nr:uncharacterized protein MONBRDRAFT_28592 [Monosiga brevicollis MX1]EDQ86168.1 predicted protein [Monosiga brevicollis MX1]|eukprot:XP_001749093.1 hypothetical protein [Monosiga brevicollis MX1]